MRAVLLAAGLGTRLRPLTDHLPKCLVEVGGQTLLDIWLDALAKTGVEDVLVNVHHFAGQVQDHVERRPGAPRVRLVHEPELLGSAGTLRKNREFLGGEGTFLALNADNLTDFDLQELIDAHRAGGAMATLTVFQAPRPSECGIIEVHDGTVHGFEEKPAHPRGDLANAGMYAFEPEVLDLIEAPAPCDIGFDLLPRLVGRARAVSIGDAWFADIGTREALERATREWHEGRQR